MALPTLCDWHLFFQSGSWCYGISELLYQLIICFTSILSGGWLCRTEQHVLKQPMGTGSRRPNMVIGRTTVLVINSNVITMGVTALHKLHLSPSGGAVNKCVISGSGFTAVSPLFNGIQQHLSLSIIPQPSASSSCWKYRKYHRVWSPCGNAVVKCAYVYLPALLCECPGIHRRVFIGNSTMVGILSPSVYNTFTFSLLKLHHLNTTFSDTKLFPQQDTVFWPPLPF